MIRQRTTSTSSLFLISSFSRTCTSGKDGPHGHRYGKTEGDREYHTAHQLQKSGRKRGYLNIHDRFTRDTWFRKSCWNSFDRTEEVIREMDKLTNEDTSTLPQEEELNVYRDNWRILANFAGPDTMPIRHRPDFKKRCHSYIASRKRMMKLITKIGESSSSSWCQWQDS